MSDFARAMFPLRRWVRWVIPALFFLVPLTFFPGTTEVFELNKQVVLVVLTVIAALAWLGGMTGERVLKVKGGVLINVIPLLFLSAVLVSTVFSIAGAVSWVGYASQQYTSFLTFGVLVTLFYVLLHTADARLVRDALIAVSASVAIAGIGLALSLFGIYLLPWEVTHVSGFNPTGTINSFVAILVFVVITWLGLFLTDGAEERGIWPGGLGGTLLYGGVSFLTVLAMILLISLDHWSLWVVFLCGLAFLMSSALLEPRHFPQPQRFVVPIVLFFLSAAFLFLISPWSFALPVVITPNTEASVAIARQALLEDGERLVVGTGPGSYGLNFARYHSLELNRTGFWDFRFEGGASYFLTLLPTLGLLGVLTWGALIVLIVGMSLNRLIKHRFEIEWKMHYALFAGWITLAIYQFLGPSNITLSFLFWAGSGLLAALSLSKVRTFDFATTPRSALAVTSGLALVSMVGVLAVLSVFLRYSAEIAFAKAVRLDARDDVAAVDVAVQMQKAVDRDPQNPIYQRNLASAYLQYAKAMLADVSVDEEMNASQQQRLRDALGAAEAAAVRATETGPRDARNWMVAALVYEELMSLVLEAETRAITALREAVRLEPANPVHLVSLGRVYLTVADRAQKIQDSEEATAEVKASAAQSEKEILVLAEEVLNQALTLKSDYAHAHYYLSATYERQGKLEEAAERLSALTSVVKQDVGLGFELGVLYVKLKESVKARAEFERVLKIAPQYSNALWYLAALEADEGNTQKALELLGRVLELNPGNEMVQSSIATLEAGLSISENPEPLEEVNSEGIAPVVSTP